MCESVFEDEFQNFKITFILIFKTCFQQNLFNETRDKKVNFFD